MSTTALIGTRLSSLFRLGMTKVGLEGADSPGFVVARQELDAEYLPGSSVKPVSYSMGRCASSAAVASD